MSHIIVVGVGFDQTVDVMLSPVVRDRDFKYKGDTQQGFLCVSVRDHLQDCKVLKDRVHHVLLWQILEFMDKIDHVFAHLTPVQTINITTGSEDWWVNQLDKRKSQGYQMNLDSDSN